MTAKTTDRFMGSIIPLPGTPYQFHKVDSVNWQIEYVSTVPATNKRGVPNATAGQVKTEALSYHPTLGKACKYLAGHLADEDVEANEDTIDTLEVYARRLREIGQDIEDAVNEYTKEDKARIRA